MKLLDRIEAAYWLTLTFKLEGERKRDRNGLVLTASRRLQLGLLELVLLDPANLPEPLQRFRRTLERLQAAEAEVSGMAFLVNELADRGVEIVPITHAAYPPHLARTLKPDAAPTLLSVVGNVSLLEQPGACISGSRKAGREGLTFASEAGAALARASIAVVTGLAAGPDREGLAGCLDAGGRAIGVAPEGILVSRATKDAAVREGRLAVVSEFHPKHAWQAGLAMARNRTLAGLSRALFVADCVAAGGTTNQVDVHLAANLPVFVRRGVGEGPVVASLARREGVFEIPWEKGPVVLPSFTPGAPNNQIAVHPRVMESGDMNRSEHVSLLEGRIDRVRKEIEFAEAKISQLSAEFEARISSLAADLRQLREASKMVEDDLARLRSFDTPGSPSVPHTRQFTAAAPSDVAVLEERPGPQYRETVEPKQAVLKALRASMDSLTLVELTSTTGISEKVIRHALKELVNEVEELKKRGTATRYLMRRDLALFDQAADL